MFYHELLVAWLGFGGLLVLLVAQAIYLLHLHGWL